MTIEEVAQLFEKLRFERDDRDPPDRRRHGQFTAGWEDATVRGKVFAENTLQFLTWHNLGYRFGCLIGHRSSIEIDGIYTILADLYDRPDVVRGQSVRLISWNVNGRAQVEKLQDQVKALAVYLPDIVVLQEVRSKAVSVLKSELAYMGLLYSTDSFGLAADLSVMTGPRQYGELLASRWRVTALSPDDFPIPWTERVLSTVIQSPWGEIEMHTAYVPPDVKNGWEMKTEMLEGIYSRLARSCDHLRILCGDFNSPQAEWPDERVVTWGQDQNGEKPIEGTYFERWDRGERSVLTGLANFDLPDVYRMLHGYQEQSEVCCSWYARGEGQLVGRRFDHIFACRALNAVRCEYLHRLRETGLSDHSPIQADFQPTGSVHK